MNLLVCYDVATEDALGRARLRRVAKVCKNFGQRVQKSVFECSVGALELETMRAELVACIDQKRDNLRIYRLTENRSASLESFGRDTYRDFNQPIVL